MGPIKSQEIVVKPYMFGLCLQMVYAMSGWWYVHVHHSKRSCWRTWGVIGELVHRSWTARSQLWWNSHFQQVIRVMDKFILLRPLSSIPLLLQKWFRLFWIWLSGRPYPVDVFPKCWIFPRQNYQMPVNRMENRCQFCNCPLDGWCKSVYFLSSFYRWLVTSSWTRTKDRLLVLLIS